MVRETWAERLAKLPKEQRSIVISTRELVGIRASHRILAEYEQANTESQVQNPPKRDN